MIVPPPPVIPRDDDGGVRPIGAIADRVDDRGDPGGSAAVVGYSMIGTQAIGDDPAHLCELAVGDVRQD